MVRSLLAVALALAALPLCTGCRASLSQVNEPARLDLVSHSQELPTDVETIQAPALPPLPKLPLPDLPLAGTQPTGPSNDRDWIPEHRFLASATLDGERLHVKNVRNAEFFSYRDCLVDYYDRTYDLSQLQSVDFIMIPFNETRALAHTLLSFGFANGDYLGVSVEVRLERGESYSPTLGLFGQFELIYVVADERDLIRVRTEYRNVDVLVYRTKATPDQARRLLVDVMRRVNKLHDEPEHYDTLTNNCTTNIVRHINTLAPGSVPTDYRVLLPGFADNLAYELGLIDNSRPFAEVKQRARVNDLALRYKDDPHFSQRIRGERVSETPKGTSPR
jgi:Domain of unknown function (DUF4105)